MCTSQLAADASIPPATGPFALVAARLAEILVEWNALTSEEPWMELPEADRLDNLPPVLLALCAAASSPGPASIGQLVTEACRHGDHRRGAGFPDHLIFVEYQLLREAAWRVLGRIDELDPITRARTVAMLDVGLTTATRASLYGYHRPEIAALGQWPQRIETLMREMIELQLFSLGAQDDS